MARSLADAEEFVAADKANGPNANGPKPDAEEFVALDGEVYTPEPHWIRSARSASKFKGVSYDVSRDQWRVKVGTKTIKRCSSLSQACETFYSHSC